MHYEKFLRNGSQKTQSRYGYALKTGEVWQFHDIQTAIVFPLKVDERKPCTAYLKNDGAIKVIMSSERKCAILVYIMSTLSDTRKMARQDYQKNDSETA